MILLICTFARARVLPLAAVLTLAACSAALAQDNAGERAMIDIVQIVHRDPARIRETITPALDPRGSIGQMDDKLIIATTAANLRQLSDLIATADVPPRRLVIGVDFAFPTQDPDSNNRQQGQAIEAEEIVFIASARSGDDPAGNEQDASGFTPAEVTASDDTSSPRISIVAEVVNDSAAVNISLRNMPGAVPTHILRIPLGVWQVIEMSPPDRATDTEPQPDMPSIAVRVDRVP